MNSQSDHMHNWTFPDGSKKEFPTYRYFVAHLIESGEIKDEQELLENKSELLPDIYFDWIKRAQVACLFAVKLAHQPAQNGWGSFVLDSNDKFMGEQVADITENSVINPKYEATQFIFKNCKSPSDVVNLVNTLCDDAGWYWKKNTPNDNASFPNLCLGLRWMLSSRKRPIWALGIAPFEPMPITRRFVGAPFSTIVFRSSDPEFYNDDERNKGMHLADIPFPSESDEDFKKTWDNTHDLKKRFLGNELSLLPWAEITFALPVQVEGDLVPPEEDRW
jgi:hypothetical protein